MPESHKDGSPHTRCPHCKSDYVKPVAESRSGHTGLTRTFWVCGSCNLSFETETVNA